MTPGQATFRIMVSMFGMDGILSVVEKDLLVFYCKHHALLRSEIGDDFEVTLDDTIARINEVGQLELCKECVEYIPPAHINTVFALAADCGCVEGEIIPDALSLLSQVGTFLDVDQNIGEYIIRGSMWKYGIDVT